MKDYEELKNTQTFLITEDAQTATPTHIKERKINDLTFVEFDTKLQSFQRQNRNKRIYLTSYMLPSLDAPHLKEMESKKSWMGEAGHPMSEDPKRIMTIDPKLISHKIEKHWIEGDCVYGHISTLTSQYGKDMTALILQGMEPAFSLRAMCPMKDDNKSRGKIQSGKAFIITYDWVFYPSHDDAYRDTRTGIKLVQTSTAHNGNVMESSGQEILVQESAVLDYIRDYSKSIRVLSEMWEVCTENMEVTKDGNWAILKNDGDRIYVSIEDQLKKNMQNFLRHL